MPIADLAGDLKLYYEDDAFTDPWIDAETVILHHGNAKNARLWHAWVPLLARDFRVVRFDARGFGRSSIPAPGYPWTLDGFAADLAQLMDHLGIERAHLVGETVGGTIALQFAYRHPDRLHSVTTCSSPYTFRGLAKYREYRDCVANSGVEAWVRQTTEGRLGADADPAYREWYIREMSRTAPHVVLETLAYLATVDLTPVLPEIATPALVMVGQSSAVNVPERTQRLVQLLPNASFAEVPGAGGFVQHTAPAQCVAFWRAFVARSRPAPAANLR